MKSIKVVYITGCLGFIGSYVTKKCLELGWYVRGIDKQTYASRDDVLSDFLSYPNFTFENKDINDIGFLYDCDYIINTAAETHVGNSIVDSRDFVKSNIDGVHNILNLLKNYRQEQKHSPILIHFSTDEVYGDIESGEHVETDLLKPSNPYSATKAAADMLILAWARTYGIKYNIIRPTNNYGIGQYVEKLVPKSIKFLSLNRKIPLHNNGTPVRNWLHADDTALAVIKIIESGTINEIYNICGGFEQDNYMTVTKIINNYYSEDISSTDYLDLTYSRSGQDVRYALNDDKLRNIGWEPKKTFDLELPSVIQYYKEKFIW
jgi:dTDP-glucose 4,6-dehydratase